MPGTSATTVVLVLEGYVGVAVSAALLQMLHMDPNRFTEIVLGLEYVSTSPHYVSSPVVFSAQLSPLILYDSVL